MKKVRRLIALILSLAMVLSTMTSVSFAEPAEDDKIELSVQAATEEKLKAGDELTATLTVPAAGWEFSSFMIKMAFNKDVLEVAEDATVTGIEGATANSADDANEQGFVTAGKAGTLNVTQADDIALTVKFKVKDGVYEGSYEDLITIDQEASYFTDQEDSPLEVAYGTTSYDADIDGLWKPSIPEGAPFDEVWTDKEDARITIADTGRTVTNSQNNKTVKLYLISIPLSVSKVYFKFNKADGSSQLPMPTYSGAGGTIINWAQFGAAPAIINQDLEDTDEYRAFSVNPVIALDEDGKAYKLWANDGGGLCALTFAVECDHSNVEHKDATVTCTADGQIEYWHCNDCDRYYSDEAMTKKVQPEDLDVKALGHVFGDDQKCTRCGVRGTTTVQFIGNAADKSLNGT